jgi:DNA-binding IclR family transcriptional regulator
MPVRLKLKVKSKTGETIKVPASVNTDYSSEGPEVLILQRVTETLNLKHEIYERSRVEDYFTVSGRVRLTYMPEAVSVLVLAGDRTVEPVQVHTAISARVRCINKRQAGGRT